MAWAQVTLQLEQGTPTGFTPRVLQFRMRLGTDSVPGATDFVHRELVQEVKMDREVMGRRNKKWR